MSGLFAVVMFISKYLIICKYSYKLTIQKKVSYDKWSPFIFKNKAREWRVLEAISLRLDYLYENQ